MECMNCGKKTVGEKLCPKCQKTKKIVKCDFCGEEIIRDKDTKKLVFMCDDCKGDENK